MIVQYFESLMGPYVPVEGAIGLDSINYDWLIIGLLLILTFHLVMMFVISLLRKVVKR